MSCVCCCCLVDLIYNVVMRHSVTSASCSACEAIRLVWSNNCDANEPIKLTSTRRCSNVAMPFVSLHRPVNLRTVGGHLLQKLLTCCSSQLRLLVDLIDWFRCSDHHASLTLFCYSPLLVHIPTRVGTLRKSTWQLYTEPY